jgi:homoserine trans-succinylase
MRKMLSKTKVIELKKTYEEIAEEYFQEWLATGKSVNDAEYRNWECWRHMAYALDSVLSRK